MKTKSDGDKPVKKVEEMNPDTRSGEIELANIDQLGALFPELITEDERGASVNIDVLKALVGDKTVSDGDEKYGLNWHGKRNARNLALTPSTGTLRPDFEGSVDWSTTQNLMIEGDNLEVLKLLQKSYSNKVKLIYIDPPYNTGKDFVYADNFQDNVRHYLEVTGQIEGGKKTTSNTETSGRFHTDWLNMMYPRLKLARNLLGEDGLIAISIDDNEIDHLRNICNEIFGEENYISQICVQSNPRGRQSDTFFATVHEYLLIYAKSIGNCVIGGAALTEEQKAEFSLTDSNGMLYRLLGLRQRGSASLREDRPDMFFPIYVNPLTLAVSLDPLPGFSEKVLPHKSSGEEGRWMWGKEKCRAELSRLVPRLIERRSQFDIFVVDYLEKAGQERTRKFKTIWDDKKLNTQNGTQEVKELLGASVMSFPKPLSLLKEIVALGSDQKDLILDFFAGSGTTGHAVMSQNADDGGRRRYILVQLPEQLDPENKEQKAAADFCDRIEKPRNLSEITEERLRRAGIKIGIDSAEDDSRLDLTAVSVNQESPLDLGFRVFKLDSSNIRPWTPDINDLARTLIDYEGNFLPERSEADILYEIILKLGLNLCVDIAKRRIGREGVGKDVHVIGGGVLIACLADEIAGDDVEPLAQGIITWHKELSPIGETTCIFRDSAFVNDVAKTNLASILKQAGILNVRSL